MSSFFFLDLPSTTLSTKLERHIQKLVHDNKVDDKEIAPVYFKVFSSKETTEVLPLMGKHFKKKKMSNKLPYRSRTIMAFQRQEGKDILFFLYVLSGI